MESYVVLARRYRPRTFSEVLGQEAISRTLVHAIETGRVAHAYLFAGPRGIGKTSMARILAKALCCSEAEGPTPEPCGACEICTAVAKGEDLDVIEIDGASNRGIEEIRTLRDNARFTPARARLKIYIIDEVHMLTPEAFNALLKILEEPPAHVKFIFATTEPQKIPPTILSRCQRFDYRRIPTRTIVGHLRAICEQEKVEAGDDVLFSIAQSSVGGMRDSQSLLDQLITLGDGRVSEEDLASLLGTVHAREMEELFRAVGEGNDARTIEIFERAYDQGIDPAEFLKQALSVARDLLVLLACGEDTDLVDLTSEGRISLAEVSRAWGMPRVLFGIGLLSETLKTVKTVGEGRALVTFALVKLARAGKLRSLDDILKDLDDLERRIGTGGDLDRRIGTGGAPARPAPVAVPAAAPVSPEEKDPTLFKNEALPEGALRGEDSDLLTVERAREAWAELLERVRGRSSAVGSYLASGVVMGLRDDAVTVGFPPSARFQKTQLDDPEHIRIVEEELSEVFRGPLRLDAVVTEGAAEEAREGAGEVAHEEGEAGARVTREEIERVGREPIVNALKELLNARLVHIERT